MRGDNHHFCTLTGRSVDLYLGQYPADQMMHPFSERVDAPVRDLFALWSVMPLSSPPVLCICGDQGTEEWYVGSTRDMKYLALTMWSYRSFWRDHERTHLIWIEIPLPGAHSRRLIMPMSYVFYVTTCPFPLQRLVRTNNNENV